MMFEENKSIYTVGERIGWIFGYFLFTTILFFVLTHAGRLPSTWNYGHVMIVTAVVGLIGIMVEKALR